MLPSTWLGTRVTLLVGPGVAVPAPLPIAEALTSIEVVETSGGRDGFQLTFSLTRGPLDALDYLLTANPLLRPFSRVVVLVTVGPIPQVLIDGFITQRQVTPGNNPCEGTMVLTGEDVRVMMDLQHVPMQYPQMPPHLRVQTILLKYAALLVLPPIIIPGVDAMPPAIIDRVPTQSSTDLAYIQQLAEEAGYVFQVEPTPIPMLNQAYWGPENHPSMPPSGPQSALSINLGPNTNVRTLSVRYDALSPTLVFGAMQEPNTRAPVPLAAPGALRVPLAALPALAVQAPFFRTTMMPGASRFNIPEALARVLGRVDRSLDAVTAEGELDTSRYGGILRARKLVGVRGAGYQLDGFYLVNRVTHQIKRNSYLQKFSLKREGLGSLTPVVVP
jgi:hypothetical protein